MSKKHKAFGEELTLKEFSYKYGISVKILYDRMFRGKSLEESLKNPPKKPELVFYSIFGERKTAKEWVNDPRSKVSLQTFKERIKNLKDKTMEECLTSEPRKIGEINYIDKIFGDILIREIFFKDNRTRANCLCLKCNKQFVERFDCIKSGSKKNCGCDKWKPNKRNCKWKGHGEIGLTFFTRIKNGCHSRKTKGRILEFNITIEYIWDLFLKQNRKCALSGMELNFQTRGHSKDRTASLDRIDSSKGYIEGNVQWVHLDINFMKGNMRDEEFIYFCKNVSNFSGMKYPEYKYNASHRKTRTLAL